MAGKTVTLDALQIQFDVFCSDSELEVTIKRTIDQINEVLRTHLRDSIPQVVYDDKNLVACVQPLDEESA